MAGREYAGDLSVTKSGRICQRWDSDEPLIRHFKNSTAFPEGSASAAGNKCRNPNGNQDGVWCHADVFGHGELCDVPFCGT